MRPRNLGGDRAGPSHLVPRREPALIDLAPTAAEDHLANPDLVAVAVFLLGAGVRGQVFDGLAARVGVPVGIAAPRLVVRVDGRELASWGRPFVIVSLATSCACSTSQGERPAHEPAVADGDDVDLDGVVRPLDASLRLRAPCLASPPAATGSPTLSRRRSRPARGAPHAPP